MSIFEKRMSSFVDRGNKLIAEGKTKEAMKLITHGLQHYSDLILRALTPYSSSCFFLAEDFSAYSSQWSWHPGCRRAQSGWQMTAIGHALLSFPMRRSISLWLRTAMGTELSFRARCTAVIISP